MDFTEFLSRAVKFASGKMKRLSGSLKSAQPILNSLDHSIDMPVTSDYNSQPPASVNVTRQGGISELHKAVKEGNVEAAKVILDENPNLVTAIINQWDETALHAASYEGHILMVVYLVSKIADADLELKNSSSNTALHLAAQAGHVDIAEILVKKNKALLDIKGSDGKLPLQMAASSGKHDMVLYLYEESQRMRTTHRADKEELWTAENRGFVLLACVQAEVFDVAQDIVKDFPDLARSGGSSILEVLACKPHAFCIKKDLYQYNAYGAYVDEGSQARQFLMAILSCFCNPEIDAYKGPVAEGNQAVQLLRNILANIPKLEHDDKPRGPAGQIMEVEICKPLFVAVKKGNTAFIDVVIHQHRMPVHELNDKNQNIFHVAALYRHAGIFKLLDDIGSIKELIFFVKDGNEDTLLHLAAKLEETTMTNQWQQPNLQMEQEEIWFKMVSNMLPPSLREMKNKDGLTPSELFTKDHKELFSKAVKSEQMIISACLSTGMALIVATVFVAIRNQQYNLDIMHCCSLHWVLHLLLLWSSKP